MAHRYLKIKNYRNVGISKEQELLLNTSTELGKLGGMVILVGPNNSGKSNCLDALYTLSPEQGLSKSDYADFLPRALDPEISLVIEEYPNKAGYYRTIGSSGEKDELFIINKGEKVKTKTTKNVVISKEAKDFAEKLLGSIPLKTSTPITQSEEAKSLGKAILQLVVSVSGNSSVFRNTALFVPRSMEFYNAVRQSNQWNTEDSYRVMKDAIAYLDKYIKSTPNWISKMGTPYSTYNQEKIDRLVMELTVKEKFVPIHFSPKLENLFKLAQYKKPDAKVEVTPNDIALAIQLIRLAGKNNSSMMNARGVKSGISDELQSLASTVSSSNILPSYPIASLLEEAHNYLLTTVGVRYYQNRLNGTKADIDQMLKAYQSSEQGDTNVKPGEKLTDRIRFEDTQTEMKELIGYAKKHHENDLLNVWFRTSQEQNKLNDYIYELTTKTEVTETEEISLWERSHNLQLHPSIIRFEETVVRQSSLTIPSDDLGKSDFFNVLFKAIGYSQNDLKSLYNDVKSGIKVLGNLRNTEYELNRKLEDISTQFNKLFFHKANRYEFRILLETGKIEFSLFVGDLPLNLDKQSTGFRWFFNFYFTVIAQKNLQRGDIIIMDEPATNLHVSGIQELRSFIKEYAKRTELTFVISTHSPFFIDIDHLDEVRVVSRKNNEAIIENKFQAIEEADSDALRPIKDALTVGRHILMDPKKKTIFVEGMTDYCYLSAFKHTLGEVGNGLYFLPIQGLKNPDILEQILHIDAFPTILVDNDHYGNGLKVKAEQMQYKDRVEVITLAEINPKFTVIESLFAEVEKPKDKKFETAVTIKNQILDGNCDTITRDNFAQIFENIAV